MEVAGHTVCAGQWLCGWRVGGAVGGIKGDGGDGRCGVQQKEEQMR